MTAPGAPPQLRRFDAPPPEPPTDDLEAALAKLPAVALAGAAAARVTGAREALETGRRRIEALHRLGASGRTVVRLHSALLDRLLRAAWSQAWGDRPGAALVAIGGYGRSELSPHSDVDLLFLHDGRGEGPPPEVRAAAEDVLYLLWDSGLQVGHAVRSLSDCLELAEADHTARTALVDCRCLAGDPGLYQAFEAAMLGQVHSRRVEGFVRDKLDEWRSRRERFGATVFRLEPDVKNGEGGLRDLHTALWVARAVHHVAGLSDMGRRMLLPRREVAELRAARDFVWRVRNGLHYRARRRDDHLTFDAQEDLSRAMGYRDVEGELGVERFMRDYYLSARTVMRVSGHVLERAAEGLQTRPAGPTRGRRVGPGFLEWQGRLTVADRHLFEREPVALLRLFETADREDLPIHSFARDLVREAALRFDDDFRAHPDVARGLRRLLTRPGTRGAFLQPMHETGLLGALVPEFGRQTGLWQHDLYHTYTVDVHSLFALRRLLELRRGDLFAPGFEEALGALGDPYALLLGTWLHDVGKGLGGGHSEKGAAMIPEIARRLHLTREEADDVAFLVREHLRMSHVSQRRDLSDPALIGDFADEMGSTRRLRMLYLLTFADVGTTGEGTWTGWKAALLTELFVKTRAVLEARAAGAPAAAAALGERAEAGLRRLEAELGRAHAADAVARFLRAVPDRYRATMPPEKASAHLALLARQEAAGAAARRIHHAAKGYTELTVAAADRAGLLADLTGALAAHRVDILGADVFSLADARILDVFLVSDRGGLLDDRTRWERIREDLLKAALEPGHGERLMARRLRPSGLPPRPAPPVAVQVRIDNDASAEHTVIDVFARDRVGLLHTITHTLHGLELSVAAARIATEAHRATDAFYVTDAAGRKITDPARLRAAAGRLEAALATADEAG